METATFNYGWRGIVVARLRKCGSIAAFLCALFFACPSVPAQQRVVAILVADTQSADIKDDMEWNIGSLQLAFESNIPANSLDVHVLKDRGFSRASVLRTINRVAVRPQDTIAFFYCGHGFYDPGQGTFLTPAEDRGARFYFSEIRRALEVRQARFRVSILDCCSVIPGGINARPAPGDVMPPAAVSPLFRSLFFEPQGSVIINSSKPGEYAVCRWPIDGGYAPGSLFTGVLLGELWDAERNLSWRDLHARLTQKVDEGFQQTFPQSVVPLGQGQVAHQRTQTVWTFLNGREIQ